MRQGLFGCVLAAILAGSGVAATACRADWVQWSAAAGGNDHWYEVVYEPNRITWDSAAVAAEAKGGYLACISSAGENAFVYGLVDDPMYWSHYEPYNTNDGPWLGGYTPTDNSNWKWVDGEAWGVYANWGESQPDSNGVETRLDFWTRGMGRAATWNNVSATNANFGYVVEYDTVPEAGSLGLLAVGVVGMLRRRK